MNSGLRRRDFLKAALAASAGALLYHVQTVHPNPIAKTHLSTPSEPERLRGPFQRKSDGSLQPLDWGNAIDRLADALGRAAPEQVAFLLGTYPDHLYHLAAQLTQALGGARLLRFSPSADLVGQTALFDASRLLLGSARPPIFDPQPAQVVFSFGSDRKESWIAEPGVGSTLPTKPTSCWVQFEPRCSPTAHLADRWVPILPGSEAQLAYILWQLGIGGDLSALEASARLTGIPSAELRRLAELFFGANRHLALPGRTALSSAAGLKAAEWILRLNLPAQADTGFYLAPPAPLHPELSGRSATAAELAALAEQMRAGWLKVLIIHGVDLLTSLPKAFGLPVALAGVETVVSLSPDLDATARCASLLLPDRAPDESWGYQMPAGAADRARIVLITPQTRPRSNTRSSCNVLIQLARRLGIGPALPYQDEQDFLHQTLSGLTGLERRFSAQNPPIALLDTAQQERWERPSPVRFTPLATDFALRMRSLSSTSPPAADDLRLLVYPLEEDTPETDCAFIHPHTAVRLGFQPGQQVRLVTEQGQICLPLVYELHLHPMTLAVPWAPGADPSPLDLIGRLQSATGELTFSGLPVRLQPIS